MSFESTCSSQVRIVAILALRKAGGVRAAFAQSRMQPSSMAIWPVAFVVDGPQPDGISEDTLVAGDDGRSGWHLRSLANGDDLHHSRTTSQQSCKEDRSGASLTCTAIVLTNRPPNPRRLTEITHPIRMTCRNVGNRVCRLPHIHSPTASR